MRTLTDVFAPGASTLPEGLRTLAVSPERELEPGMTVRVAFTFRNQGGAPATGVRVRFNLPDGLVYLVGTGHLDGADVDDEHGNSALLARAGADIGDVGPGEERRIDIAYSVAGAIENGSMVELQAAVAAFELAPVGSNIVRLVARSRPALQNALTTIAIDARGEARPGGEATIALRIHNAGESSAHDVVAVAPIPEHTSYVPNSARLNGREFERDLLAAFDRAYAPVIVSNLPASATATLQYRVRIDEPLADGTAVSARATIASQESPGFDVPPAAIVVSAHPNFEDEQTFFSVEPGSELAPGSRVVVRLRMFNAGTASAHDVKVTLTIPDGVFPVRASATIDGHPLPQRKKEAAAYDIGTIPARESVEFVIEATAGSPIADATPLMFGASLQWNDAGSRSFERTVTVRSLPYFALRRCGLVRAGKGVLRPSDECEATVNLINDGSAGATDAVLHVHVDPSLDDLKLFEKNVRLEVRNDAVELGAIDPYGSRKITMRARVRTPLADRSDLRIATTLHTQELGETPLGEAVWRVESHPAFSVDHSSLQLVSDEVFRPNQLVEVFVRLRNEGTDVAQNVRMRLYVSPEARLENVEGATRDRSTLLFGELGAGATAEARLGVRLLRSLAKAHPVTVDAVLSADAMLPIQLGRLTIITTAEPNFSVGTLRSEPAEIADAGSGVEFVLHVRNGGDGPARRVKIAVGGADALIYIPNSTLVNDLPVRDTGSQSPLSTDAGVVLTDVDPGVEATIRWSEVVHKGLPAGESIVRVARIVYDGDRIDEIVARELKVRCEPAFANTISGLPFGLDGRLGPAFGTGGRVFAPSPDERYLELPPATPVPRGEAAPARILSLAPSANGHPSAIEDRIGTALYLDATRLDRALKLFGETRFEGLVTHVFALRILFADAAGTQSEEALRDVREFLRETSDRLFIKLRLPNYVFAPRDVETPAMRSALDTFLGSVQPGECAQGGDGMTLRGECDLQEIHALRDCLQDAPPATALAWAVLARFVPDETEALKHYRGMLIASLDDLSNVSDSAFIDTLQRRKYPVLDAALDVVRAQLALRR